MIPGLFLHGGKRDRSPNAGKIYVIVCFPQSQGGDPQLDNFRKLPVLGVRKKEQILIMQGMGLIPELSQFSDFTMSYKPGIARRQSLQSFGSFFFVPNDIIKSG
jgi:hypothetical protein